MSSPSLSGTIPGFSGHSLHSGFIIKILDTILHVWYGVRSIEVSKTTAPFRRKCSRTKTRTLHPLLEELNPQASYHLVNDVITAGELLSGTGSIWRTKWLHVASRLPLASVLFRFSASRRSQKLAAILAQQLSETLRNDHRVGSPKTCESAPVQNQFSVLYLKQGGRRQWS